MGKLNSKQLPRHIFIETFNISNGKHHNISLHDHLKKTPKKPSKKLIIHHKTNQQSSGSYYLLICNANIFNWGYTQSWRMSRNEKPPWKLDRFMDGAPRRSPVKASGGLRGSGGWGVGAPGGWAPLRVTGSRSNPRHPFVDCSRVGRQWERWLFKIFFGSVNAFMGWVFLFMCLIVLFC